MDRVTRYVLLPGLLGGASVWLAFTGSAWGDWPLDAGPAVRALTDGDVSGYLHAAPIMGTFATLLQTPFWLLGGGGTTGLRLACLGCLLVAAALGWYLAALAGKRGAGTLFQLVLALLCVVNPVTVEALATGHPEEILTAALAIGAVAAAVEGRGVVAAVLLGLAVASKQWAILAIFPVLMALPDRRFRCAGIAVAIVAVLTLPALLVAPSAFFETQGNAASGGQVPTVWSVWHPFTIDVVRPLDGTTAEALPGPVVSLTHPLIVAVVLLGPLALWAKRGWRRFGGAEVMALLALLALLRCALDPVDNLYYHAPLLLALLGWDAFSPGRLPWRGIAAAVVALLLRHWAEDLKTVEEVTVFNAVYIAVACGAGAAICRSLFRPSARAASRSATGDLVSA